MVELDSVQIFIDLAARCRQDRDLADLLEDSTKRLGFDYFALVHHVDLSTRTVGRSVALWNYPDAWAEEYVERKLATRDPVHLASHRTNVGFAWDELPRLITITPAHRRVRERTRDAGVIDGFTVPANIPGEANGSCSFAIGRGRAMPRASLASAHLIGAFGFQAARRLLERRWGQETGRAHLSPRQLDCLVLIGRGCSDRDAARQLGIAEDTVSEYLDDARRRYGVARRTTLVLRAIFDGQIALSDVLEEPPPLRGEAR